MTTNETGRMTMKIKTILLCALAVLCTQTGLAWGAPILATASTIPSDLNTPLTTPGKVNMYTNIACTDASTGNFVSCGYDFSITGLKQPDTDPANNGVHTHAGAHPVGTLKEIWPVPGNPVTSLNGYTQNTQVVISHQIPDVSGKIETVLNLRVPPGWHTVYPESCNGDGTSWCFNTTVDVGLNLTPLPDAPGLYTKARKQNATALAHTDAVAFYGTDSALRNLTSIADWYNWLTLRTLSINDMSLIKGGLFDVYANYSPPHHDHRTGESADINKDNGDCTKNKALLLAVLIAMPPEPYTFYANRKLPSFGHFLCETSNSNNIHIDL
jgi:hypothetical protein